MANRSLTTRDVFELRKQGRIEEAYAAARELYSTDKNPCTSLAMFWTAIDILRIRFNEGKPNEARKILAALEQMLAHVPDKEGNVKDAYENCQRLLCKTTALEDGSEQTPEHLRLGAWGEDLAAAYLRDKGYVILERDWRSTHRDIDIIARDAECVIFVEVKTRKNSDFGSPVEAVDYKKRKNLRQAINHYIKYHHIDLSVRFDIITVVGAIGCKDPEICHLEDINIMELTSR